MASSISVKPSVISIFQVEEKDVVAEFEDEIDYWRHCAGCAHCHHRDHCRGNIGR